MSKCNYHCEVDEYKKLLRILSHSGLDPQSQNSKDLTTMRCRLTRGAAFTLAEVLITLAIIGVVAAITIPTLITTNQEKGWNTAATVFERKLEESLKVMNSQGTLAGYKNTFDFVNELSKHLKITKICKNDDLLSCFEDSVIWGSGDANPEEVDMTSIKTAAQFGQEDWKTNLVGIQLANGTSGLIAYNPECKQDPYSNQITGTSCLALLYDTSGFAKPNTSGKDLRSINVPKLNGACFFSIGGTCFGTPFYPTPHVWKGCDENGNTTNAEDLEFMAKYNIEYCMTSDYGTNDYWAGAVAACGGGDKMLTGAQLGKIADYIYNTNGIGTGSYNGLTRDDDKVSALGFTVSSEIDFFVWTGLEYSSLHAYGRSFHPNTANWGGGCRNYRGQAVCLGD